MLQYNSFTMNDRRVHTNIYHIISSQNVQVNVEHDRQVDRYTDILTKYINIYHIPHLTSQIFRSTNIFATIFQCHLFQCYITSIKSFITTNKWGERKRNICVTCPKDIRCGQGLDLTSENHRSRRNGYHGKRNWRERERERERERWEWEWMNIIN